MPRRIVVLDDDVPILDVMQEVLEGSGYAVICLSDAAGAYALLRDITPDLLILDLKLGDRVTGWDVLATLRKEPLHRRMPVIICTADMRAVREGADGLTEHGCRVLEKPFHIDELLAVVGTLIGPGSGTPGLDA